jgi:hypothetical protein
MTSKSDDFENVAALLESGVLWGTAAALAELRGPSPSSMTWRVKVPRTIRMWCASDQCQRVMNWDLFKTGIYSSEVEEIAFGTFKTFTYNCRNTPNFPRVTFVLHAVAAVQSEQPEAAPTPSAGGASPRDATITLIGRMPRPTRHIDAAVAAALHEIDRYLYEQALASRLEGKGIGAMTYMRRVVENEMNRLLDLLVEQLASAPDRVEQLRTAQKLQDENAFAEKARVADLLLPTTLFPGNQNPFSKLHDLCSEGVHLLDDVESCDRFDEAKELFELLFLQLLRERESRRLYDEKLKKLTPRK